MIIDKQIYNTIQHKINKKYHKNKVVQYLILIHYIRYLLRPIIIIIIINWNNNIRIIMIILIKYNIYLNIYITIMHKYYQFYYKILNNI